MSEPADISGQAPILPWAINQVQNSEAACHQVPGISLATAGLELHDKIEVKWSLVGPDEQAQDQWWGARIIGKQDGEDNTWNILYDALYGFDETQASVVFTSRRTLLDNELDTTLRWRKEGEFQGDTTEYEEDDLVTLDDIVEEGEDVGLTAEFDEAEIKKLPVTTQAKVAEGLNEFKNAFEKFIQEIVQEKGEGCVINVDDISKFSQKLRKDSS